MESRDHVEEFLQSMEDYNPTIPDEVTAYYLNRTGFSCTDVKVKRMIALAAQKFVSDIANDALQYCKIRQQNSSSKEKQMILTIEDLQQALGEYGISIGKPLYFADRVSAASSTSTGSVSGQEKGKAPASTAL